MTSEATPTPAPGTHAAHRGLSVEEHRALVAQVLTPGAAREYSLASPTAVGELLGLTLAEPVTAAMPVPPMTNSAMDGFAVRLADLTAASGGAHTSPASLLVTLPVSQDIPAGTTPQPLQRGTAARIMTGAALPAGADTVVRVEDTDHQAGIAQPPTQVTIMRLPRLGADIRTQGEDVKVGDAILQPGIILDAASLAAAIGVGACSLLAYPRPRVGILSTGSELREPGSGDLLPHGGPTASTIQRNHAPQVTVPDSNGPMLEALVREAGAEVSHRSRVPDDPHALLAAIQEWDDVDLILTAGGISQGAFEVVRQALTMPGSGATMRFHHVAQQPGGPQGVGTIHLGGRKVPVLSLPGNPVSSFVTFHVYVRPALALLAGATDSLTPRLVRVQLAEDEGWTSPATKLQFMPVFLDPDGRARRVHMLGSGSHLVASLARGHALALVPAGVAQVSGGQELDALLTRPHALNPTIAFPFTTV